ncbi:MAG: type II secretion system protein [Planctomycetota bacterium]
MSQPTCGTGPTQAFTLIEVIAALVLMAGLLVSCLTALSSYQVALANASQRSEAIKIADRLLTAWHASSDGLPSVVVGTLPAPSEWSYQTRWVKTQALCEVPVAVMRLEIFRTSTRSDSRREMVKPVVAVSYVRPLQKRRTRNALPPLGG